MRNRLRLAAVVLLLATFALVMRGVFFLLNQPHDWALYSGVVIFLASFVVYPKLFHYLRRKR